MDDLLKLMVFTDIIRKKRDKALTEKIKKLKFKSNVFSLGGFPSDRFHYNKAIDDVLLLIGYEEEGRTEMAKQKTIDLVKELRHKQILEHVEEYKKTGDTRALEDIEAVNEYYDDVLLDLHATSMVQKFQNYS